MASCAAAHLGGCKGHLERHHVFKRQRLRSQFPYGVWFHAGTGRWNAASYYEPVRRSSDVARTMTAIVEDERNIMLLCSEGHHEPVTKGQLHLSVPDSVWEFCRELGIEGQLENDLARQACGFCHGRPVGNAATWVDGKPRPPAPCPRCGQTYEEG